MQLQKTQRRLLSTDTVTWRDVPSDATRLVRPEAVPADARHSAGLAVAVPLALMTTAAAVIIGRAAIGAGGDAAALAVASLTLNVVLAVMLSATAIWFASGALGMDEHLGPALAKLAAVHTILALCVTFGIAGVVVAAVALLAMLQWLFDLDTVEAVATTLVVALMHAGAIALTLVVLPYADGFIPLLTGLV